MIESVAQILESFIAVERKKLEELRMPHNPTLGEAYEKLIEVGLQDYGIKRFNLDLHVVSGFLEIDGELVRHQIDCMLVVGEGSRYGLTDKFIYDVSKVLIIFEVKKKLTPKEINKAVAHLSNITSMCTKNFVAQTDSKRMVPDLSIVKNFYAHITSKASPSNYQDIHSLEPKDQIVLFSLLQDNALPLRIVHSFEGYKTEEGFRNAYLNYVEKTYESSEEWRISVPNHPNLITSGEFAIVKGTGQPYFIQANGKLILSASTQGNIARVILEVIWIKISRYFNVRLPWGEDLDQEILSPLVRVTPRQRGAAGWEYHLYHQNFILDEQETEWKPFIATQFMQDFFMDFLINGGAIDYASKSFELLCRKNNLNKKAATRQLTDCLLFTKENGFLVSVYGVILMAEIDSKFYITHDHKRFYTWCEKYDLKPSVMRFTRMD